MNAFYKLDNGVVLKAVSTVTTPTVTLDISLVETYIYPVEGWYMFESDKLAYDFFGVDLLT